MAYCRDRSFYGIDVNECFMDFLAKTISQRFCTYELEKKEDEDKCV